MKYVYVYVLRKHPFCSTQKKKEASLLECAGTIGHVAHGKSTVVKAISGMLLVLSMRQCSSLRDMPTSVDISVAVLLSSCVNLPLASKFVVTR